MSEPMRIKIRSKNFSGRDMTIELNGVDVSRWIRRIRLENGVGSPNTVQLEFTNVQVDAEVEALLFAHRGETIIAVSEDPPTPGFWDDQFEAVDFGDPDSPA